MSNPYVLSAATRARFKDVQFLEGHVDALLASRPVAADSVAALLVDPVGLLIVRHAPGYAPDGVRKDLSRLIR